jgi:hypothetical protein
MARNVIEAELRDKAGYISLQKYQDLAGSVLRGLLADRAR